MEFKGLTSSNKFFINIIGLVVVFIVLKELQAIFIPLVLAYFLFFVFSPLNNFFTNKGVPLWLIIIGDLLILLFLVGGMSTFIINSFSQMSEQLPQYEQKLNQIVSSTAKSWGLQDKEFTDFQIANTLSKINYLPIASDFFSSTFSVIGTLFFVIFFFIFVLTGYRNTYNALKNRYLFKHMAEDSMITPEPEENINQPEKRKKKKSPEYKKRETKFEKAFNEIADQMQRYVIAKFLISLLSGFTTAIILAVYGVDFYLVWAIVTFLFNFIPNIGSIISIILPGLMALIQFDSIGYAVAVILTLSAVDVLSGYFLEPKVFGHTLGLNPLVLLLALLLWGYIWGIVGVILSVPLTALIKIVISRSDSPNMKFLNDLISG